MNDPCHPAYRAELVERALRLRQQYPDASIGYLAHSLAYEMDMKVEAIERVLRDELLN